MRYIKIEDGIVTNVTSSSDAGLMRMLGYIPTDDEWITVGEEFADTQCTQILCLTPNEDGMYSGLQSWNGKIPPADHVWFPDSLVHEFYKEDKYYAGFVDLIIVGDRVRDCVWNEEAYQAYLAEHPYVEPKPIIPIDDRVTSLEESLALTDEVAIELYEAQAEQEEINMAQDDALIEIYEMIGG